jgi:aerobic carbon-monoxide dehydrogenase large subunit
MGDFGIGASVRRKEDFRFLTGRGTYTDDVNRPAQLHAFLRLASFSLRCTAGLQKALTRAI